MIEQAENVLRDLGFYDVRVRHHELRKCRICYQLLNSSPYPLCLHLARIEVGPAEMRKFLENGDFDQSGRGAQADWLRPRHPRPPRLPPRQHERGSARQIGGRVSARRNELSEEVLGARALAASDGALGAGALTSKGPGDSSNPPRGTAVPPNCRLE